MRAAPARGDWTQFRGGPALSGVAADPLPARLALAWTFEAEDGVESSPAIAGGTVYFGSLDGHLYALDLATGKQRFRYAAGGEIKSSPAVRDGLVYVGDEAGTFHAVDARTGARRWAFEAGGALRIELMRRGVVDIGGEPHRVLDATRLHRREQLRDLALAATRRARIAIREAFVVRTVVDQQRDRLIARDDLPARLRRGERLDQPRHLRLA